MDLVKKMLKVALLPTLLLFSAYLLRINYKLYHGHSSPQQYKHLQHLKKAVGGDAAARMQEIYPEGGPFIYALYGLAWAEYGQALPKGDPRRAEAETELAKAVEALFSEEMRLIFPEGQNPGHGAFYEGWSNYLLGKKLALANHPDTSEVKRFRQKCDEIATTLRDSPLPYLESYPNSAWPADITVGVAGMALHDRLFSPRYTTDLRRWVSEVEKHLDDKGMIPHYIYSDGAFAPARGSSMSLMLCFLKDIDPAFAERQYQLYKTHFLTYRFGLPGIREHRHGIEEEGDIDSGPVILSVGGSASVVGRRAAAINGDKGLALGIGNSVEGWGFGWAGFQRKNYLFGVLPVADAFIAWTNGARLDNLPTAVPFRRWKFHLWSLLPLLLFAAVGYGLWRM